MSGIRQQTVKSINFVWNSVCLGFVFTRYAQGLTFLSEQYVIVRLHIHFFPPFVHPAVAYTYIQNIHPLFFTSRSLKSSNWKTKEEWKLEFQFSVDISALETTKHRRSWEGLCASYGGGSSKI